MTEIGDKVFSWCNALTSINIPNSVTEIGKSAFFECRVLTSIIVAKENKVYDSRDNCNAIIETYINCLIQGCDNTVIPDSVTEIGNNAFRGCAALTSVNIPKSVTKIGDRAFYGCKELTSITIPNSVTKIGDWAFSGCNALTSVTIPNSVTEIGDSEFYDCWNLEELILCHTDPTQIWVSEEAFSFAKQATLYVPKEGVAAFQKDPFWSEFAAIKPITDDMLK